MSLTRKTIVTFSSGGESRSPIPVEGSGSAETENLIENARKKLIVKNADFVIANDVTLEGAGFNCDTNIGTVIDKNGSITELPKLTKAALAVKILDLFSAQ